MSDNHIQEWCPNCHFFYKEFGLNYCNLTINIMPYWEPDKSAIEWLKLNSDDTTRIHPDADNCPCFIPFPELAQKLWCEKRSNSYLLLANLKKWVRQGK
jgi:hypothetical protein